MREILSINPSLLVCPRGGFKSDVSYARKITDITSEECPGTHHLEDVKAVRKLEIQGLGKITKKDARLNEKKKIQESEST